MKYQRIIRFRDIKRYFISCDYYTEADRDMALADVLAFGKDLLKYRHFEDKQGQDGLDGMRHNLRVLKNSKSKRHTSYCMFYGRPLQLSGY